MDTLIDQFARLAISRCGASVDKHQIADLISKFSSLELADDNNDNNDDNDDNADNADNADNNELIEAIYKAVRSLMMKPPCRPKKNYMESSNYVF